MDIPDQLGFMTQIEVKNIYIINDYDYLDLTSNYRAAYVGASILAARDAGMEVTSVGPAAESDHSQLHA